MTDKEIIERHYNGDRTNPNNLSQWFPKIKNVPRLKIPATKTIPVPIDMFEAFEYDEVRKNIEAIKKFVQNNIIPEMQEEPQWFMKNGCYSNKFDFRNSITTTGKVLDDFISIQYASACLQTSGVSEINLREIIPWNRAKTATIYHGMPLRTEIRVFYDFDHRKTLYSANYWDYDYVRPNLHDRTDIIVFEATREEIAAGYIRNRERAEQAVAEAMRDVDMTGKWSVDLLIEQNGNLWLIDMAQAERSAYWKGRQKNPQ